MVVGGRDARGVSIDATYQAITERPELDELLREQYSRTEQWQRYWKGTVRQRKCSEL
ncbi:hypothetical protein [Halobiforma nitratireducens]|uniref:hypothetical protein n=1 Tax=Halobiforma nitratireducens TaxID=130048 RepID=UPI0014615993|nr:hypothetical protein [Halobiforma nitratireducens]